MSGFFNVGDAVTLTKLAIDLYQNVFLVAKAAPESFNTLCNELVVVKNVLGRIDARYELEGRDEYGEATRGALDLCEKALLKFRPLVIKYRKLASANAPPIRQKLKYPFDQGKIRTARDELQKSLSYLNVALATDAVLGPTDVSQPDTRHSSRSRQPTVEDIDDASVSGQRAAAQRLLHGPTERSESIQGLLQNSNTEDIDLIPLPLHPLGRIQAIPATEPDDHLRALSLDAATLENRQSNASSARSYRSQSSSTYSGPVPSTVRQATFQVDSTPIPVREDLFSGFRFPQRRSTTHDSAQTTADELVESIYIDTEERAEIAERLRSIAVYSTLTQLLREEAVKFSEDRTALEEWLACGNWWLLKSRKIFHILDLDNPPSQEQRTDWPINISSEQASIDLFKACYVLESVVFTENSLQRRVTNAIWKSAKDLAVAVRDELRWYKKVKAFEDSSRSLSRFHLGFSEKIQQPIETVQQVPAALDSFQPLRRWLAIDTGHAGEAKQRVRFRTFVNAQIGDHMHRRKSQSAPYLLVLWSQDGSSELIVSLANQIGTVNLCCTLTENDLHRHAESAMASPEFELTFPSQDSVIQFLNQGELSQFLEFPKNFFEGMDDREARPGEFLVFRDSLQSYDKREEARARHASIAGPATNQIGASCEISLYQHIASEIWKSQRRLVISSASNAAKIFCYTYWLPLCKVRTFGEGKDVELQWSDCNQLEKTKDGYHGHNYSLVWRPEDPNIFLSLRFTDATAADEFKAAILRPWATPFETETLRCRVTFGSAGGAVDSPDLAPLGQELSIWQLMDDAGTRQSVYLSITYIERIQHSGFVASLFFIHRDVDFAVAQTAKNSISFPQMRVPHYTSNHIKEKWRPKGEGICDSVDWGFGGSDFHFEHDEDIPRFMDHLMGWQLMFTQRIPQLQCGTRIVPGSFDQRNVFLTLWAPPSESKHRELRLSTRFMGEIQSKNEHRWTTVRITFESEYKLASSGSKLILKNVDLSRGSQLDIKDLVAVDSRGKEENQHKKSLVLSMPDATSANQLHASIWDVFKPTQGKSSALFRPLSSQYTLDSASSNDASKFLQT